MKIEENELYTFKLNSGEEIVGKVHSELTDCYEIEAPLSIGQTQQGPSLVPTMMTVDLNSNVFMYKNSIAIVAITREDVADAYRESTTGIKVPDKKIILG